MKNTLKKQKLKKLVIIKNISKPQIISNQIYYKKMNLKNFNNGIDNNILPEPHSPSYTSNTIQVIDRKYKK